MKGFLRGLKPGLKRGSIVGLALVSALVLLAAAALAAEETVSLGDYEVSFDLGNYTGYELDFEEVPYATVDGEEYPSHVCWIQGDRMMMIALTDYGVPMAATSSITRRAVVSYLNNAQCTNIQTHEVDIAGKPAILGLGERPSGETLVCTVYWPDIHDVNGTLYGQVDCTIASEASVELTEMLLNSISVKLPGEEEAVMGVRSESDRIEL
jgi:hypothetical protein